MQKENKILWHVTKDPALYITDENAESLSTMTQVFWF